MIKGIYQLSGCSQSFPADASLFNDGRIEIIKSDTAQAIRLDAKDHYQFGDVIPGLAVDIFFDDGAIFTPSDSSFRWKGIEKKKTITAWLESHWIFVICASLFVPFFLWTMTTRVLPAAADASVELLPDVVAQELSQQTLIVLDKITFDPTELSEQQQNQLTKQWDEVLTQLKLSKEKYRLFFRSSEMGANAMALPDGSVIVIDDIVTLMESNPHALTAVLLHEIGHVEYQHGMKQLARTTATTLLFTMMFGDIEGAGELILGAGTGLLQNAFSRDMETQADIFAHEKLKQIGRSANDFADAIVLLESAHDDQLAEVISDLGGESANDASENKSNETAINNTENKINHWLEYLSSHPDSKKRIEAAKSAK
ncbi:M48 family metallopeptidase [Pelagibaculum spongiae]|uniref:Peptidase n=1 Tax=Pelagibaculum spongiae TaxID=2080658 RepID=A0A2V1GVS6_9GAMM|nr:M48 family metallopeptidase [Pelagibaculum spongiae]PVZ63911.1 peptidase [Pelagibaculum spongiae]